MNKKEEKHWFAAYTRYSYSKISRKWNIHKRAEKRIKCGNAKVKKEKGKKGKSHKKGLLKMKSSAINRIQIEVAPKRLIYTRSFCAKSKDNTNWNTYTTNEYIHTYIDFLYLYRYMCIYTLSKRRQAAVQNLGRSKCSTFSTHAHTNIFIHIYTYVHFYSYSHVHIFDYFHCFSLLYLAALCCAAG